MRALPVKWQRAAIALFATKGIRTEAVKAAGFIHKTPHSRASFASQLFMDPRMRAAISELCAYMLETIEPELFSLVLDVMRDANTDAKDKLRAAAMIWDRTRPVKTSHKVEVEHTHHLSNDELDVSHYRALKKLGSPHSTFLQRFGANGLPRVEAMVAAEDAKQKRIAHAPAIETSFEEVTADD